jgi:DNA modification methylase
VVNLEFGIDTNRIICGDCAIVMHSIPENFIDLTITSPPYDDLRDYNGYVFDFESIAHQLYRVTKIGGVVVWVVGDKIIHGNRTLTSFKQGLFFQSIGFNMHDVMIYEKKSTPFTRSNAYTNYYEYMFILTKGSPCIFHPIKIPVISSGNKGHASTGIKSDGIKRYTSIIYNKEKTKSNIWTYAVGLNGSTRDKIAFEHPAIFPEKLAEDHIMSWSNEGDIILDPMCGSGTTLKMAKIHGRHYIGIDISEEYCDLARRRVNEGKMAILDNWKTQDIDDWI